jgi:glycosyltransferase involved in cell wall biosynthesis
VFNSPFRFFEHKKILRKYTLQFGNRIKIKYYPVLPPLRYVLGSVFQTKLIMAWLKFVLFFIKISGDIIHCRSYWPAVLALKIKNEPVVFDVRSLYPAESVSAGKLKYNSKAYKYWMLLERFCFEHSKAISVVSYPMIQYVESISNNKNILYNPIIVDTSKIYYDAIKGLDYRKKLGWDNNLILVYSGSLGYNGLNKLALGKLLRRLTSLGDRFRFLFLSDENQNDLTDFLKQNSIAGDRLHITKSSFEELNGWLSCADIGLHALPQQLDSNTRLGTKVVEYWANGLPVILNENVGAAVKIVEDYSIGSVVTDNSSDEYILSEIKRIKALDRNKISEVGKHIFDAKKIARGYINIYNGCL